LSMRRKRSQTKALKTDAIVASRAANGPCDVAGAAVSEIILITIPTSKRPI